MPAAFNKTAPSWSFLRARWQKLILALAALILSDTAPTFAAAKPNISSEKSQNEPLYWPPIDAKTEWEFVPETGSASLQYNLAKAKIAAAAVEFENRATIVLVGGRIVFEAYDGSLKKADRDNSWSIGSAVTSVLIGRAIKTGAIKSLDEPAELTEWKIAGDGRQNITIRNLLAMNSGIIWHERNAGSEAGSDANKMLFGKGQLDVVAYAAAKKSSAKPGERFTYSTGDSVLLSAALQRRLPPLTTSDGKRTYALQKFMNAELFDKLGMTETAPQFDIEGNFYTSLIWMNARDLAKFGEFCLRDGVWNKERLLPEGWVQTMRTPSSAKDGASYGAGFWIKAKNKPDSLMASLPDDAFAAGGDHGQVVVMIPSKDLVIVRLGLTPYGEKSRAALGVWLGEVAGAFPDVKG